MSPPLTARAIATGSPPRGPRATCAGRGGAGRGRAGPAGSRPAQGRNRAGAGTEPKQAFYSSRHRQTSSTSCKMISVFNFQRPPFSTLTGEVNTATPLAHKSQKNVPSVSPSERWLQFKHRTEGGFWCCWKRTWPTQKAGNREPGHHIMRRLCSPEAEARSCSAVGSRSIKERVLKGKERTRAGREGLRRDSKGGGNALNVVIIRVAASAVTPAWL